MTSLPFFQTGQSCTHFRAFAFAVSSAWNVLSPSCWQAFLFPSVQVLAETPSFPRAFSTGPYLLFSISGPCWFLSWYPLQWATSVYFFIVLSPPENESYMRVGHSLVVSLLFPSLWPSTWSLVDLWYTHLLTSMWLLGLWALEVSDGEEKTLIYSKPTRGPDPWPYVKRREVNRR